MSTTFLAFLILGCSIFVFFSQEFGKFFKKVFAIWGMKAILPLSAATLLFVMFEPWIVWIAYSFQRSFISLAYAFASILPFPSIAIYISLFVILSFLTIVPGLAIDLWIKRKHFRGFAEKEHLCFFTWLILSLILISGIYS